MNWLSDANQAAQRATAPAEHSELTMLRQFNGFTYIPQLTVDSAKKFTKRTGVAWPSVLATRPAVS
jgi:hypothetical protein